MKLNLATVAICSLLLAAGCGGHTSNIETTESTTSDSASSSNAPDKTARLESVDLHEHKPGTHGGIMVSLGRDSYHVEAVFDSEGTIRLYTLGQDETRVIDIEQQTLHGFVRTSEDTESKKIDFLPSPQDGDAENRTSLFVGRLPEALIGQKELEVTIPNIRIEGERFRLGFQTKHAADHSDSPNMPSGVASDTERELYLTPGGRYTEADIAANGNMTASEKFKGIKSEHDMKPQPGDKLCPISGTKANPKFTWVIDGKPYEFCCPPCVDEFLGEAKTTSEPLADPSTFIKK